MKGNIYLIYDTTNDVYKIGVTKSNCDKRLKQLQTGNSNILELITSHESNYPYRMETMLHNHFANKRILNEWFSLTEEDVISFKDTCNHMEEIIHALKDNAFFTKNIH